MMENVTLTQKEQARLQVLNSILAEHMTTEQAAEILGVSTRHTRRILAAYKEDGAAALAHGNRGRRPHNATSEMEEADVLYLARTRYEGAKHTHLSELLREREGIGHRTHHAAAYLAERRSEQSAQSKATAASGTAPTDAR